MSIKRNHDYTRVIPRDLFNEAKLLKCLGRLCLLIHEGRCPGLSVIQPVTHNSNAFKIWQDQADGSIYVSMLSLRFTRDRDKKMLRFATPLNCKSRWPLLLSPPDPSVDEITVFVEDSDGELTQEFLEFLEGAERKGDERGAQIAGG